MSNFSEITDASGVVPGGPADKYDQTHASDQRIEAHDTILQVDGEVATEANILRLLRGDGKVGGSARILVQKFQPSPLNSAVSTERISEGSARDPVEVTLYRDYKWWVEGMRDVAVAVEQVSNDMGASSARSNDEGLMHTVWQMEVNKQLRKLSKLSATSQQNLRNHIEALEDALSSALGNANSETIAVEQQLSLERDELRARLESAQQLLREQELERELEKRRSSASGGDAVVVERYREMIGALQHDLQALSRHPPPLVPPLLRGSARRVTFVTQASNLHIEIQSQVGRKPSCKFVCPVCCVWRGALKANLCRPLISLSTRRGRSLHDEAQQAPLMALGARAGGSSQECRSAESDASAEARKRKDAGSAHRLARLGNQGRLRHRAAGTRQPPSSWPSPRSCQGE